MRLQTPPTELPQKWYIVEFIATSNKQAIGNALLPDLETAKENFLKEYPGAKITNMLEKSVPRNEASAGFAPKSKPRQRRRPESPAREFPSSGPLAGEQYPQTRLRILTADDVRGLSIIQLQYAIDEVYVRYGAILNFWTMRVLPIPVAPNKRRQGITDLRPEDVCEILLKGETGGFEKYPMQQSL